MKFSKILTHKPHQDAAHVQCTEAFTQAFKQDAVQMVTKVYLA